jgi:hypothetical protein
MSIFSLGRFFMEFALFGYVMILGSLLIVARISPTLAFFPWEFIGQQMLVRYLNELQQGGVFLAGFVLPALFFSLLRLKALSVHDQS